MKSSLAKQRGFAVEIWFRQARYACEVISKLKVDETKGDQPGGKKRVTFDSLKTKQHKERGSGRGREEKRGRTTCRSEKVAEKKSVKTMGRGDLGIQYINRIDRVAATDAHIHKPAPPPRPVKPATADLQKGPAKSTMKLMPWPRCIHLFARARGSFQEAEAEAPGTA
jgi:hypothetical protein